MAKMEDDQVYRLCMLLRNHGARLKQRTMRDGRRCLAAKHSEPIALRIAVRMFHQQHGVGGVQVDVAKRELYWPQVVVDAE